MAAITPLGTTYRGASVRRLFRKRVAWLIILVAIALLSSAVIAAFEETLESAIVLAFFIPLLIGAGGNTGAQSSTLVIRALATGDLSGSQLGRALGKELLVGLLLGASMGAAASLLGVWRGGVYVGVIVGVTMLGIVLTANLIGATLPFVLTRLRLDPAVASSPLIQTFMDAIGLTIYFATAVAVLSLVGPLQPDRGSHAPGGHFLRFVKPVRDDDVRGGWVTMDRAMVSVVRWRGPRCRRRKSRPRPACCSGLAEPGIFSRCG